MRKMGGITSQQTAYQRIDYPEIRIPTSMFTAACCVSAEMTVPEPCEALGGIHGVVKLFMKHPLKKCNTNFKSVFLGKF